VDAPLAAGESSRGTFSIAIVDAERAIAVGGDFQAPDAGDGNAAFSLDGGATWQVAATRPGGYRSAVATSPAGLVSVGTAGADLSTDGGETWTPTDPQPSVALNAVAAADGPCALWAVGPDGAVVRWRQSPGG
ncbi:MAG: hypothetical protein AAGF23_19160, partial [Acidobacteriota bacterium]